MTLGVNIFYHMLTFFLTFEKWESQFWLIACTMHWKLTAAPGKITQSNKHLRLRWFMWNNICLHVCTCSTCVQKPWRMPRREGHFPGIGVERIVSHLVGTGLLEEQRVLLPRLLLFSWRRIRFSLGLGLVPLGRGRIGKNGGIKDSDSPNWSILKRTTKECVCRQGRRLMCRS